MLSRINAERDAVHKVRAEQLAARYLEEDATQARLVAAERQKIDAAKATWIAAERQKVEMIRSLVAGKYLSIDEASLTWP